MKEGSSSSARMLGKSWRATHELAAQLPPWTSSAKRSMSTPQRAARLIESDSAATWMNQSILVSSLDAVPAGAGPSSTISLPIASSCGRAAASAASVAPHMNTSLPEAALSAAPVTGPSTYSTPAVAQTSPRWRAVGRSTVEALTRVAPGRIRAIRPSSPKHTAVTCCGAGSERITTSSPTGPGCAATAPSATSVATRSASMSSTARAKPPLSRLRAMPAPMEPRPTIRVVVMCATLRCARSGRNPRPTTWWTSVPTMWERSAMWIAPRHSLSSERTLRNASCGTSTAPTYFMRFFLPFFCFSSSLRLREMSPP